MSYKNEPHNHSVFFTEEQMVQIVKKAMLTLFSTASSGSGLNLPPEGKQSESKKTDSTTNKYLCSKETADFLGISQSTLKEWKRKGMIPYSQNTYKGRIFYEKSDLIGFLQKNRRKYS